MSTEPNEITFWVPGESIAQSSIVAEGLSEPLVSIRVGSSRGDGGPIKATAVTGRDVVVMTIADGPTLVLHPEDARDLLRAQAHRGTRSALAALDANDVEVVSDLVWAGLDTTAHRGVASWVGKVVLRWFSIVSASVQEKAVDFASCAFTQRIDGAVIEGVYRLSPDALPASFSGEKKVDQIPFTQNGQPLLILVHGTFVDTVSTFGRLWDQHTETVARLFERYESNIYALDHATIGRSPIANALTLVQALPSGARIHLLTHSRGGLVAEVLARACAVAPGGTYDPGPANDNSYTQHQDDWLALVQIVRDKRLQVERIVRVACPARGTTLASRRFDAYLSVFRWGLQLANVPVLPILVDFLHEVARRRADPAELPGIEAMMPESPFIRWLNSGEQVVAGELRVVAGDLEGDSVISWTKTLLADAFYWGDNDLVVQTRSMFGGVPRTANASFLLDAGGKVSHFNYFSNERTVRAIASTLIDNDPADFALIGPLSWSGAQSDGKRAAKSARGGAQSERPAVFVLPGILGSHLKLDGDRIWLGWRFLNGFRKLNWDPQGAGRIEPDGPIGHVYNRLIDRLDESHEVIEFAYDWRRPIEDVAKDLAIAVASALASRSNSNQPVRLLAHSMGGLVVRAMEFAAPDVWKRLMTREGARVLMLGTPNAGSWAPMQTLSGDETFGNTLIALGSLFDNAGTRQMMAGMPGFIQLQAGLRDPALALDKSETWQRLADEDMSRLAAHSIWHNSEVQRTIYRWGAPPQSVLDQAIALRRKFDAQAVTLGDAAQKILLVVGSGGFTPGGFAMESDGLAYFGAQEGGDGRVALSSAMLPGVRTWRVSGEHGALPNIPDAIPAYIELLTSGQTAQLEEVSASELSRASRGGRSLIGESALATVDTVRSRPSRRINTSRPPSTGMDVLSFTLQHAGSDAQADGSIKVAVVNCDLKYVRQALFIGHYSSMRLTGAERAIDQLVGGKMDRTLRAGIYPDALGSNYLFDNERDDPDNPFEMARPSAVVVIGLGNEGKLRVTELTYAVRQAVLVFAQRLFEKKDGPPERFELAATLIGSGGKGISAGGAARAVVQGGLEASQQLHRMKWPQLSQITIVEQYLERAGEAWRALQAQASVAPGRITLVGRVVIGQGALQRSIDSSYRGVDYDFISVMHRPGAVPSMPCLEYKLDSKRARTEVSAQHAQSSLLKELVAKASNNACADREIGRTLFNLLVPVELEPFLSGTGEMVMELEPGTAAIPWELLDTNADPHSHDERPWAIRCKLIRKLRMTDFRAQLVDASVEDNILVIGDPMCDRTIYPPLAGARHEAVAVAELLSGLGSGLVAGEVMRLPENSDAQRIINALFKHPYRVIHVAGHGKEGTDGGVVLSGPNTYLGASEVKALRTVPELVFLNCCHLAARDAGVMAPDYDHVAFAANIADALIGVGVRCVIAAGWAVEDAAAEQFATQFYTSLLGGARFIEAVGVARAAAWNANRSGNTWAAYQCYGDPEWSWRPNSSSVRKTAPSKEFSGVASPVSLLFALERIAVRSEVGTVDTARQLEKLQYLQSEFGSVWGNRGAVAESFGVAYAKTGDVDAAIEWFRRAVLAEDGGATLRALESLGQQLIQRGQRQSTSSALNEVDEGVAQLEALVAMNPTFERECSLASTCKWLAQTEYDAKRAGRADILLTKAYVHFTRAQTLANLRHSEHDYQPFKDSLCVALRHAFLTDKALAVTPYQLAAAKDWSGTAAVDRPNFRSMFARMEVRMLESLTRDGLHALHQTLTEEFDELKLKAASQKDWKWAYDEARFTLEPYIAHSKSTTENSAAEWILKSLRYLATA